MTATRALVVGEIGSFPDCWKFQKTIGRIIGASVRTVQRAIAQAKALGLVRVHRNKKGEIPPRGPKKDHAPECDCFSCKPRPLPCGWSHRWAVGRGLAGRAVEAAVHTARLRFISRASVRATHSAAPSVVLKSSSTASAPRRNLRGITAEQIDRELEQRAPVLQEAMARARAGPEPPE